MGDRFDPGRALTTSHWVAAWSRERCAGEPDSSVMELLLRSATALSGAPGATPAIARAELWRFLSKELGRSLWLATVPVASALVLMLLAARLDAVDLTRDARLDRLVRHGSMVIGGALAFGTGIGLSGSLASAVAAVPCASLGGAVALWLWATSWPGTGWLPGFATIGAAVGAAVGRRSRLEAPACRAAEGQWMLPSGVLLVLASLAFALSRSAREYQSPDGTKLVGVLVGIAAAATIPVVSWSRTTRRFIEVDQRTALNWHLRLAAVLVSAGGVLGYAAGAMRNSQEPLYGLAIGVGAGLVAAGLVETLWLALETRLRPRARGIVVLASFVTIAVAGVAGAVLTQHADQGRALLAGGVAGAVAFALTARA